LLPLAIIKNRNRGGAYLSSFFVGIGLFSMFLFLTYFFQIVQGYTPLQAGMLFLPFSAGIIVSAGIASQLMPRFGPRYVTFAGFALATAGMLLLTRLTPDSTYWPEVLPAMIIISLGMGLIFVPLSATALFGVGDDDTGVASAVLNTAQQIGGSVGIAFLNTIATSATAAYVIANNVNPFDASAQVKGYVDAFTWGAGILVLGGILWVALVKISRKDMSAGDKAATVEVQ
jgi:MFS family permease